MEEYPGKEECAPGAAVLEGLGVEKGTGVEKTRNSREVFQGPKIGRTQVSHMGTSYGKLRDVKQTSGNRRVSVYAGRLLKR